MKRVILALGFLCVTCGSYGDPGNLEDGVFIAHHPPGIQYSHGQDWCQRYIEEFAISNCKQQHNRIDLDGNEGQSSIWYVVAAWTEDKEWCGTEFGFGRYDPSIYGFVEWGSCCPEDDLEIPTEFWPGPGQGTAVVVTGTPWSGKFVAVYYFAGYAYSVGIIPLGADPATGFGGTGNCDTPPQSWGVSAFGGMGLFTDGIYVCPGQGGGGDFGPEGYDVAVCCLGEECRLTTAEECAYIGGEFYPEWASCDADPCGLGGLDQPACTVPSIDYPTIQAAVADAACKVIELLDMTFTGPGNRDIEFPDRDLTIRSLSDNPEDCIIDVNALEGTKRQAFRVATTEPFGHVLRGVTIKRGSGHAPP
jgi:hypothetical protein